MRLDNYVIIKRGVTPVGRVNIVETDLTFSGTLTERQATNYIVVHHIGETDRDVEASEIHQWHLNNGWAGIGYHYVIRKDGSIERGRPRQYIGSHCYGSNWETIGINVVGDFMVATPNEAQLDSLANLVADLCDIYGLDPEEAIIGHKDRNSTDCPGDNLYPLLPDVKEKVKGLL